MNSQVTPQGRVTLTLLGLADPRGVIEALPRTEALDYAEVGEGEFERLLAELVSRGAVRESRPDGRAARRLTIVDLAGRESGLRYVDARRDRVRLRAAQRARLAPGRNDVLVEADAVRVVRFDPHPRREDAWSVTVIVPGLGTMRDVYYAPAGAGTLMAPSRPIGGGHWERVLDWTSEFSSALRVEVDRAFAVAKREGRLPPRPSTSASAASPSQR
jgi:hypothetical protein